MRPQQQNRRMRGRGNNRKGPNPLTRSYESNGPDVKIRGTAQQVADKYAALARDAQSSGDRVMAENYLQHAEHYNRLIAAAQAQAQPQQNARDRSEDDDFDAREDQQETASAGNEERRPFNDGSGPQPVIEGTPAEVALKDRQVNGSDEAKSSSTAKPNGRRKAAANGKANGHDQSAEGAENTNAHQVAEGTESQASKTEGSDASVEEGAAEAAPKPVKRTRRPRTRKVETAPASDASEGSNSEEVAAQS